MKLKDLLKLSWLETIRYKSVTIFLVLNLALGLIGFFLLQIFQQSLTAQSAEKAQVVLGGDMAISARRAFTPEERASWEKEFKFTTSSQFYSLFSMLRGANGDARLTSVGAFDSHYPLYGKFKLSGEDFNSTRALVWADPEIAESLNLKIGDLVEIGEIKFAYAGAILEDPTRLFRGTGFAPRVLIHKDFLQKAGLIQPGSTFSEAWSYKTPVSENLTSAKTRLEKSITDPVVRIENTKDSAEDSNRVLRYFADYLGLVALVALGLCFLCGSYLLQWTFLSKKKNIAIYKTLGLSDEKIILIYLLQNFMISLLACLLGFILVESLQPLLQKLLTDKFNLPLELIFSPRAILFTNLIAILGPMFIVIPQILQIIELRPLLLLQNVETRVRRGLAYFAWVLVAIGLFWALAVWQSNSLKIASMFTASLVSLIVVFQLLNRLLLYFLEKMSTGFEWRLKYAIRGLTRKKASAGLVFTTMSLATLVLSLLPHVKTSIINEVRPQQTSQIPSLFLFDIQPGQVDALRTLAQQKLSQNLGFSPLVRARILKVNDRNYERTIQSGLQTREADDEARFRNRGVNLTYRDQLQVSESLSDGRFPGTYVASGDSSLPQISLEKRYAERVGIHLGDRMTFDVQGLEVQAQVGSFRQVRWTSFQPNFFILFPKGVLEEAPQIFLTSVTSAANTSREVIKQFQKDVYSEFKNVSVIDVTATVETSLKYVDQMALGLQFMAWLAVMVGLFVFVVLLNTQIKERLSEMNLLQILGSDSGQVLRIVLTQFVLLLVTSISFGVLLGLVMSWMIISYFFELTTVYDLQYLLLLGLVLIPVCGVALYAGLSPLKRLNPMDLIRQT